jgi:D-3-phosphoglycerate dehydrogenase
VVRGEIATRDVTALKLSALRGVFRQVVTEQVSYVNAPVLAEERGIRVELVTSEDSERFRNVVQIRGTLRDGRVVSVSGTLSGTEQAQKLTEVDGLELDVQLSDHLLLITYQDRPGLVGAYGALLGDADVNIAGMQVSRRGEERGGEVLVVLNLDQPVDQDLADRIGEAVGASSSLAVDITY